MRSLVGREEQEGWAVIGSEEFRRLWLWSEEARREVRAARSARLADLVSRVAEEIEFERGLLVPHCPRGENVPSESRFRLLLERSPFAVNVVARDGTSLFANERWNELWGLPAGGVPGNVCSDAGTRRAGLPPHVQRAFAGARTEVSLKLDGAGRPGGPTGERCLRVLAYPIPATTGDGHREPESVREVVILAEDISARALLERDLARRAFHDEMTGLPNRSLLLRRAEEALRRGSGEVALLFLDLDDFKQVNDSLGHAAGNALLVEVARRLATSVRAGDTVARYGGDEFVVLLEEVSGPQEAAGTARRMLEGLRTPFLISGRAVTVTCSIGVATSEADDREPPCPELLLSRADDAMYRAKLDGKDRLSLSDPDASRTDRSVLPLPQSLDGQS